MKPVTDNFFDGIPDDDKPFWQIALSLDNERARNALAKFDIVPVDPMDDLLKAMQQAVLSVDQNQSALKDQIQVLLRYWAVFRERLDQQDAEIQNLNERLKKLESGKN